MLMRQPRPETLGRDADAHHSELLREHDQECQGRNGTEFWWTEGYRGSAILGMVGGDPDKKLEVIAGVTDEDREECRRLNETKICDVNLAEDVPNLYIEIIMESEEHTACVRIANHHTDIVYMKKDEEVLRDIENAVVEENADETVRADRNKMSLQELLEYANTVDLAEIKDVIQRQIEMNSKSHRKVSITHGVHRSVRRSSKTGVMMSVPKPVQRQRQVRMHV